MSTRKSNTNSSGGAIKSRHVIWLAAVIAVSWLAPDFVSGFQEFAMLVAIGVVLVFLVIMAFRS